MVIQTLQAQVQEMLDRLVVSGEEVGLQVAQHYRRVKELEEHAAPCGYVPLHHRAPAGRGDRE